MKKFLVFTILVALSFSTSLYCQEAGDKGAYIGVGGSYIIEDFDDDIEGLDVDFDDTWGANIKVGYHFNNWFSLEFDFDYLSEFESNATLKLSGPPLEGDAEIDILTYMVVAKFSADTEKVKPFLVAGVGVMDADIDVKASTALFGGGIIIGMSKSDSEKDTCAKLGLGVDYFVNNNFSIGLEGDYVWGFGDLDEIRYANFTLGVAYHF